MCIRRPCGFTVGADLVVVAAYGVTAACGRTCGRKGRCCGCPTAGLADGGRGARTRSAERGRYRQDGRLQPRRRVGPQLVGADAQAHGRTDAQAHGRTEPHRMRDRMRLCCMYADSFLGENFAFNKIVAIFAHLFERM